MPVSLLSSSKTAVVLMPYPTPLLTTAFVPNSTGRPSAIGRASLPRRLTRQVASSGVVPDKCPRPVGRASSGRSLARLDVRSASFVSHDHATDGQHRAPGTDSVTSGVRQADCQKAVVGQRAGASLTDGAGVVTVLPDDRVKHALVIVRGS